MKIFGRILALFLIVPFIEFALLMRLGQAIGFWPTIGMIVATGLLGSYLAKREGLAVWRRFNERVRSGGLPSRELVDGIIVLVSGALLITPGVLSDVTGLLGMLPPTRALIRKLVMRRVEQSIQSGSHGIRFGVFGVPDAASRPFGSDAGGGWSGTGKESPGYVEKPSSGDGSR